MSNQRKRKVELGKLKIESAIFRAATSFSDQTLADVSEMLSIWGITPLQYDALCILYAEDKEDIGLPSKEVGSHLYTRVPDVTRLLDRMVEKGLIARERDPINKRIVRSRLTDSGIELVELAYPHLIELESNQLSHLSEVEKNTLAELLHKALNKLDT